MIVGVGRVKVYALEIESPTYTFPTWLLASSQDTPEDVHAVDAEIIIGITWL